MSVIIYHNPKCSTSRNTLALLRERGIEPQVIEYLKTPPDRATLVSLIKASGLSAREIIRSKEALFTGLGLDDAGVSDDQLIDAMIKHPHSHQPPHREDPQGSAAVPAGGEGAGESSLS